jgi:hypothetical protein
MPVDVSFALPQDHRDRIADRECLLNHSIMVDPRRWQSELHKRSLPAAGGQLASSANKLEVKRGDVFRSADEEVTDTNALQLLYLSLAWGLGTKASRLSPRLTALAKNIDRAPGLLREAWTATRSGQSPKTCYEILLTPKGQPRIPWLGAAFATKFLYFASGSELIPQNLILDAVVARSLRGSAWKASPTYGWWSDTYANYCDLMARWADEANAAPDQVEMMLFRLKAEAVRK